MRDELKKHAVFSRRALLLGGVKTILAFVLIRKLYRLQLLENSKYKTLSDKNRIKILILQPMRGEILDHRDEVIATNQEDYILAIERSGINNIKNIVEAVNKKLDYKIHATNIATSSLIKNTSAPHPIILHKSLRWEDVIKLESSTHIPSIQIIKRYVRKYNLAMLASHIIGYVGAPSKKELKKFGYKSYYSLIVGKNGVEKLCEASLQGQPGIEKVEVNANNKLVRVITNIPAKKGHDIKLSIDSQIQKKVANSIVNKSGAAIVMTTDGHILALFSSPSYDPNIFTNIKDKKWKNLVNDKSNPLTNRAISGTYPPGSIFKIVSALGLLNFGLDIKETVFCKGYYKIGNFVFHCWNRHGHGNLNFEEALSNSCNVYFYVMAMRFGPNKMFEAAKALGLGQKTGIELPFENCGLVGDPLWKKQKLKSRWQKGDTINATIGQGFISVTPIQLTKMMADLITGKYCIPTIFTKTRQLKTLEIEPKVRSTILSMLKKVKYKTEADHWIVGKTGTAQTTSLLKENRLEDHGLFLGFAPINKPKYVISVVIEHGSWGSKSALPVAKNIFDFVLNNS